MATDLLFAYSLDRLSDVYNPSFKSVYVPGDRGGVFDPTDTDPYGSGEDGGVVFEGPGNAGGRGPAWYVRRFKNAVSPRWFGAFSSSSVDSGDAVRSALSFATARGLWLDLEGDTLLIDTEDPDNPSYGVVPEDGCKIRDGTLRLGSSPSVDALFGAPGRVNSGDVSNVIFDANDNADHAVSLASGSEYSPYWEWTGCDFNNSLSHAIEHFTFATTFRGCRAQRSAEDGFFIRNPADNDSEVTSVHFSGCICFDIEGDAYSFGNANYCSVTASGADRIGGRVIFLRRARGVTIQVGCEEAYQFLYCQFPDRLTIQSSFLRKLGDDTVAGSGSGAPSHFIQLQAEGSVVIEDPYIFQSVNAPTDAIIQNNGCNIVLLGGAELTVGDVDQTSGSGRNFLVGSDGITLPPVSNAERAAAGQTGRVIFNEDDGQLNVDNGTDWTLPDGTVT